MDKMFTKTQLIDIIEKLKVQREQKQSLKQWFLIGNQILAAQRMLSKGIYAE